MRSEQLLVWLTTLLVSFYLIGLGVVLREQTTLALCTAGFGLLFLMLVALASRRRYALYEMGGPAIHERVLNHYVKQELAAFFPSHSIKCDVVIHKKGKVEILADIPYLSEKRLAEMETALTASLAKYCGYKGPFILNVSFS